jgi:hypothetical protein
LQDASRLNGATDLSITGSYVYATASNDDSVQVIDISTPSSPSFAAELVDDGTTELNGAW